MNHYPKSIVNVIRNFSRLPGIGEKTAERLTMHLLRAPATEVKMLAQSILELKEKSRLCGRCFAMSDKEVCRICSDPSRNQELLCIVEQPTDMAALERSGAYNGLYHILQGVLSPMDGIGPDDLRIQELLSKVKKEKIKEIIIATSTNVEGESTASYLINLLAKLPVRISRIASGVPVGGDLKYVDQVTLKRAMESRYDI
ncbi:MAG: recombination mediator RecR [Pseudomonadota bacterium]|nr:MAG: recombination protein RecR [Desulfobacteraceae bacterium]